MTYRNIVVYVLLLSSSALLLYLAFKGQDLHRIFLTLKAADYKFVILSLSLLLVAHFVRALRWNMLIQTLGYRTATGYSFCAIMVGYLANIALPRLGEITRCGVISKKSGAPMDKLIGTVITDRAADLFMLLIIFLASLAIQYRAVVAFLGGKLSTGPSASHSWLVVTGILGAMLIFIALIVWMAIKRFEARIKTWKFFIGLIKFLKGIAEGALSIFKITNSGLFILYSLLIWTLYGLSTWAVFYALPATSSLGGGAAVFVLTAGSFGMAAPVQAGIGAYHWMITQALVLYRVSKADGLAYATLNHSSQLLLVLFVGGICLVITLVGHDERPKKSVTHEV